jgi:hypothetical protein
VKQWGNDFLFPTFDDRELMFSWLLSMNCPNRASLARIYNEKEFLTNSFEISIFEEIKKIFFRRGGIPSHFNGQPPVIDLNGQPPVND